MESLRIFLVLLWTENSDWTLEKILIDNHYKLFTNQSEVSALPAGWYTDLIFKSRTAANCCLSQDHDLMAAYIYIYIHIFESRKISDLFGPIPQWTESFLLAPINFPCFRKILGNTWKATRGRCGRLCRFPWDGVLIWGSASCLVFFCIFLPFPPLLMTFHHELLGVDFTIFLFIKT